MHITGGYLGRLYSKHKIKRKVVLIKKFSDLRIKTRVAEMKRTAYDQLVEAILLGKTIYYLDECMFTVKSYQMFEYSPKNMNAIVHSS